MIPADFFPTSQRWQADGLTVYTAPYWRDSRQVGDRLVCHVACESALDTPEPQRPATETWAQGYQAAAMIAAAPEMFRILQQMGAAADLGEVDLEPEDAALLEVARAVIRRIEEAGRTA